LDRLRVIGEVVTFLIVITVHAVLEGQAIIVAICVDIGGVVVTASVRGRV